MPYGLSALWNKKSSITYSATEGKQLRESSSLEENAAFLVRWAAELYADWSTWMTHKLPGCVTAFKSSTLRIVYKIKEMVRRNEVSNESQGWKKLTDLLRAQYYCTDA